MNITLIGMPGVGKSSIGVKLASRLKYSFLDADKIIEARFKLKLQQIIDKYGEEEFLAIEQKTIAGLGEIDCCVICPGGSIVFSEQAMFFLKENSTVVFLDIDLDCIKKHVANPDIRGIIGFKGKSLLEIYKQRRPLYEKYADISLKLSEYATIGEQVKAIIGVLP